MKVFKQANLVRIVILAAIAVLVCPNAILAKPGLENPSFELPEELGLSGWTTDIPLGGSIDVVTQYWAWERKDGLIINVEVYPKDGTYFAVLTPTNLPGLYTTLSQTFDAAEDDYISGWAFFDQRDFPGFNDDAYVRIIDSDGTEVDTIFYASGLTVGDLGWTEWTKWEYTFTEEGTYTIEAGVANNVFWGGNSYMGLDGDVLTQEPKVMKQDIIDQLGMYAHESKRVRKAIREIEKSLEDKLWTDNFHLKSKGGKKVLDRERHAARELVHLLKGIPDDDDLEKLPPKNGKKGKKHQISDEAKVAVEIAIEQLVTVDRLLAEIQLKDARPLIPADPVRQDKFDREIAKAEKELAKGDEDRDDYNLGKAIHHLGKAIQHYKKAWEHATHAIKVATKLPKS